MGQGALYKYIVSLLSNRNRGATKNNTHKQLNGLAKPFIIKKKKQIDTQLSITTDSLTVTKVSHTFPVALTKYVVVDKINEVIHMC